jgi:hypothetical protein
MRVPFEGRLFVEAAIRAWLFRLGSGVALFRAEGRLCSEYERAGIAAGFE